MLLTDAIAGPAPERLHRRPRAAQHRRPRGGRRAARRARWKRAPPSDPRASSTCPEVGGSLEALADELRVEQSPRTASTCVAWPLACAAAPLIGDLFADSVEGAAQDAGDVHLGVADLLGDLRLGQVLDEAQAQDQCARARPDGAAPRPGRSCPSTSSKPSSSSPIHSEGGDSSASSPPTGRSSERGRRLWLASSTSSTSVSLRPRARLAISPTEGERCSCYGQLGDRFVDFGHAVVQAARHPHRPDPIAEVALELAEDRRRGKGGEGHAAARGRSDRPR